MKYLVSIITPTYNSSDFIRDTYQSLLDQTYSNWEWIITDDCSADDTVDIVNKISHHDHRVSLAVNDINLGAAVTRNNSLRRAKGEFIAFIDSDDLWSYKKLESQIKFMNSNKVDFSFTSYELVDSNGHKLNRYVDTHEIPFVTYEDMLRKKATLGCSTVMLRRSAFDKIEMPLIRTGQDYGLWLSLLKLGGKAYLIPNSFTKYRILPNSISRNKLNKARRQWEIYRDIEGLSLTKSIECFFWYATRAIFRK